MADKRYVYIPDDEYRNDKVIWVMSPYTFETDCLEFPDGFEHMPFYDERLWLSNDLVAEILKWKLEGVVGGMHPYESSDPTKNWVAYYKDGGLLSLKVEEEFRQHNIMWQVEFRFRGDIFSWMKKEKTIFVK
jgi:hypothetical protein